MTTETSNREVVEQLLNGIDAGDVSVLDRVFHDDGEMVWPASRELVRGAVNRRAVYSHMPVLPKVQKRRIFGSGDLWIAEATLSYAGKPYSTVLIFEFRNGKIARETGYWAEPFEAPAWRAQWVESLATPA